MSTPKPTRPSRFLLRSGRLHQAAAISLFLIVSVDAVRTVLEGGTVALTMVVPLLSAIIWFFVGRQMVRADSN